MKNVILNQLFNHRNGTSKIFLKKIDYYVVNWNTDFRSLIFFFLGDYNIAEGGCASPMCTYAETTNMISRRQHDAVKNSV